MAEQKNGNRLALGEFIREVVGLLRHLDVYYSSV